MLDADDLVRFVLTARDVETDALLPNRGNVVEMSAASEQTLHYNVPINQVFKLEVAVQDLRPKFFDFGVFRAVTDIIVDTKGVLEPAIGEVQEVIFSAAMLRSDLSQGTISISLDGASAATYTRPLAQFVGSGGSNIRDSIAAAIVELNPMITSVSQIKVNAYTKPAVGPDAGEGYVIEVIYTDPNFIGVDMPMIRADMNLNGLPQPDIENEFNVYVDREVNGQIKRVVNGDRMYHFFEVNNRNNTVASKVYGQTRVIGGFDAIDPTGDIFNEVGGLGPASIKGIRAGIPSFSNDIAYDVFAIPVIARQLASDVSVRIDPPDIGDRVLIYGTATNKEVVPDDQIQLGGNSRLLLNVVPPKPKLDVADTARTLTEDDSAITIDLATLVDSDPGPLTYSLPAYSSLPNTSALGVVDLNGSILTYTPTSDVAGSETLTFRVARDATTDFIDADIAIMIDPVNDIPVAVDDDQTVNEDTPLSISVSSLLANDIDVDADDSLRLVSIGSASAGTVTLDADTLRYSPVADFFGEDSFTYTIRDLAGATSTATVRINVIAVNDPPTVIGESTRTEPNRSIQFSIADLLSNDSAGPRESDLSLRIVNVSETNHPASNVEIDGPLIRYTPATDYVGSDGFTYTVSDGELTATARVNIDVRFVFEPVVYTLPDSATNDITVRRIADGRLEIVDNRSGPGTVLYRRPLSTIEKLRIVGGNTSMDRIVIDHASGGLITFNGNSGSIEVLGGTSDSDEVIVRGISTANTLIAEADAASPSMIVGLIANLQSGAIGSNHTMRGFESITIENVRQVSVPSSSVLDVDAYRLKLDSSNEIDLSRTTRIHGGTLSSSTPMVLGNGETITGDGTINASIVSSVGSVIVASGGDLIIGDPDSVSTIDIGGRLDTSGHTITLRGADAANLRGTVRLGRDDPDSAGTLILSNGIQIQPGAQIIGYGNVSTAGPGSSPAIVNQGSITGNSMELPVSIHGSLTGTGALESVRILGEWKLDGAIADRNIGQVVLGAEAKTKVRIEGITAGSTYDRYRFNSGVTLGGTLDVEFASSFLPKVGHAFEILTASNSIADAFDTVHLPDLIDGLKWAIDTTANKITLNVVLDETIFVEKVTIEIADANQVIARGELGQSIPVFGNTLTVHVQPKQLFVSPQNWNTQSTERIDGQFFQIARSGTSTLRIAGANWTNFVNRADINGDGGVSALDALIIINELNSPQFSSAATSALPDPRSVDSFPDRFYDTNGDGRVSAVDALQVINRLVQLDSRRGGEPIIASPVANPTTSLSRSTVDLIAIESPVAAAPKTVAEEVWRDWTDNDLADALFANTTEPHVGESLRDSQISILQDDSRRREILSLQDVANGQENGGQEN